jgi:hypothetical protein
MPPRGSFRGHATARVPLWTAFVSDDLQVVGLDDQGVEGQEAASRG